MSECDWEIFLRETASLIVEQQSPQRFVGGVTTPPDTSFTHLIFPHYRLLEVRSRLYELLTHCIPPDIIIKVSLFDMYLHVGI